MATRTAWSLTLLFVLVLVGCERTHDAANSAFAVELQELITGRIPPSGTLWLARSAEALEAVGLEAEGELAGSVQFASLAPFESGATFFGIGFAQDAMAEAAETVHCAQDVNRTAGWIQLASCVDQVLDTCAGTWGLNSEAAFEVTGYHASFQENGSPLLTPCSFHDL